MSKFPDFKIYIKDEICMCEAQWYKRRGHFDEINVRVGNALLDSCLPFTHNKISAQYQKSINLPVLSKPQNSFLKSWIRNRNLHLDHFSLSESICLIFNFFHGYFEHYLK